MSEVIEFRQHLRRVQLAAQPEAAAVAGSAQPATATELELEAVREAAFKAGQEQAMRDLRAQIDAAQALQNKTLQRLQEMEVELKQEVEAALPDLIIEGVRRMIEGCGGAIIWRIISSASRIIAATSGAAVANT